MDNHILSAEDHELLEKYARKVVRRRLEAPLIFFLESMKPLNFISSQMMLGAEPLVSLFLDIKDYKRFQQILEDRESIEQLIQTLEDITRKREAGEKI
ncbi:MAG: hypothetical protein PHW04_00840 [Candidatus Wallbacteria bacterium]|nr:hypothetical protein [Candidatus Wallbacteria bacterium]